MSSREQSEESGEREGHFSLSRKRGSGTVEGVTISALHIIDFEGSPRYGVVEYGVVTLTAEGIVACAGRLCAAVGDIPPADTRVHGIDRAMAEGRRPFSAEYERFVQLRGSGVFCAHNAVVEHNLLKHTWAYPPYVPGWLQAGAEVADWGPWLCTLQLARSVLPGLGSHRLESLAYGAALRDRVEATARQYCAVERCRPHCALYDAIATAVWLESTVGFEGAVEWFTGRLVAALPPPELFSD